MIENVFQKDPQALLDYGFDWTQWLSDGEVIIGYIVTTASGIDNPYTTSTSGSVLIWLSGGTVGKRYDVACRITTSACRIDERTIKIDVRDR